VARYKGATSLAISRSAASPLSGGDHDDHAACGPALCELTRIASDATRAATAMPTSAAVAARNLFE
jgi:hypothetical protein